MALLDPRKTGLSNGIAQQEGYPTSGETSANAGRLPAQRAQAPFEQKRAQTNIPTPSTAPMGRGTLNGGAVQGAQYKTAAQPMSPSVAGFVAIPSVSTMFSQPGGPSLPGSTPIKMNQQSGASFFGGGQQGFNPNPPAQSQGQPQQNVPTPSVQPQGQQQQKIQPMQSGPYAPTSELKTLGPGGFLPSGQGPAYSGGGTFPQGQGGFDFDTQAIMKKQAEEAAAKAAPAGGAAPTPTATGYNYLDEINKMGQQYNVGGEFDVAQRRLLDEKIRQQNMMMSAQSRLAGRGGNIAQVSQNYANQLAGLQYEAERAQLEQGAKQQQFANQMAYANAVVDTKTKMMALAKDLGLSVDDMDFNKLAADAVNQYGPNPTGGQFLESINASLSGAASEKDAQLKNTAGQIREWLNSYSADAEGWIVNAFQTMPKQTLKNLAQTYPNIIQEVLADTWGDDNEAILDALNGAGVDTTAFQ